MEVEVMNKGGKSKTFMWVAFILIAAVAAGGIWLKLGNVRIGTYFQNRFEIGNNQNIEILNRLNDSWRLPENYSLDTIEVNGITMEWVQERNTNPDKVILQLHGGAYSRSLKDNGTTYRRAAMQYAKISGAGVLTVDYRVAPEHPYPAALEDAVAAYKWLLEQGYNPENIILAGDSAGGGLTLATVLYIRDNEMPMPAALITMSAWTNLNYKRRTPAYVGKDRADNPYISPVYGEFHDFPSMLMQVGGDEVLLNDTIRVAQKAKKAGVSVQQTTYPSMFHVFQMLFPELPDANKAWSEVEAFIRDVFGENSSCDISMSQEEPSIFIVEV
jgi:monoterpene epsilon-lactone hydrolase